MRIAQVLAGISLAEADVLRKAVGKKDAELIRRELGTFVEKAVARGHDREIIKEIADQLKTFGRYGFNKSHSVAYSILSYHTAWLKTYYTAEFMAAMLSSQIGDTDNVVKYIAEAREMGIEILPPDVNESGYKFTVIGDRRIRFGLGGIRNVGRGAIDAIIAARAAGPFTSLFDLCSRIDLRASNKRVLEALAHAGALDALGGHRAQLAAGLEAAVREASLRQEDKNTGQASLFGGGGEAKADHAEPPLPNVAAWSESERLTREKEILGFYISGHPLEPYRTACELFATNQVADLGMWRPEPMTLAVVVTAIRRQMSKQRGAEFARLSIEDFSGAGEALVFPERWAALSLQVAGDVPVLLRGGYLRRDQTADNPVFVVESVTRLAELQTAGHVFVAIDIDGSLADTSHILSDLRAILEEHPGSAPVEVRVRDKAGEAARFRSTRYTVSTDGPLVRELRALLGEDRVRLERVGGVIGHRSSVIGQPKPEQRPGADADTTAARAALAGAIA